MYIKRPCEAVQINTGLTVPFYPLKVTAHIFFKLELTLPQRSCMTDASLQSEVKQLLLTWESSAEKNLGVWARPVLATRNWGLVRTLG